MPGTPGSVVSPCAPVTDSRRRTSDARSSSWKIAPLEQSTYLPDASAVIADRQWVEEGIPTARYRPAGRHRPSLLPRSAHARGRRDPRYPVRDRRVTTAPWSRVDARFPRVPITEQRIASLRGDRRERPAVIRTLRGRPPGRWRHRVARRVLRRHAHIREPPSAAPAVAREHQGAPHAYRLTPCRRVTDGSHRDRDGRYRAPRDRRGRHRCRCRPPAGR